MPREGTIPEAFVDRRSASERMVAERKVREQVEIAAELLVDNEGGM